MGNLIRGAVCALALLMAVCGTAHSVTISIPLSTADGFIPIVGPANVTLSVDFSTVETVDIVAGDLVGWAASIEIYGIDLNDDWWELPGFLASQTFVAFGSPYDPPQIQDEPVSFFLGSNFIGIMLFNFYQDYGILTPANLVIDVQAVPLPAALPMFAAGLGLLAYLARRRSRATQQTV